MGPLDGGRPDLPGSRRASDAARGLERPRSFKGWGAARGWPPGVEPSAPQGPASIGRARGPLLGAPCRVPARKGHVDAWKVPFGPARPSAPRVEWTPEHPSDQED